MSSNPNDPAPLSYLFPPGGGELGDLIRQKNWATTSLGEPGSWPSALQHHVDSLLSAYFPLLIYWGPDYIQLYNDPFIPILGSGKHPTALGGPASATFAEIWETIKPMFDRVMNGETVAFEDLELQLDKNGVLQQSFFTFSYSPILGEHRRPVGILVNCIETTDKVNALRRLQTERENIRNMVRQAPVGMCIVTGQPLMVEEINDLFLEIIGKQREAFLFTPYWVVNAEAANIYEPITSQVMASGVTYHAYEHEILLVRKGISETVFVDFVYEPIRNTQGITDAIMIVAIDVTSKVLARKITEQTTADLRMLTNELATSNDRLNLALVSANMGTWSADLKTNELSVSEKGRTMHGLLSEEKLKLDQSVLLILPNHRERIAVAIQEAIAGNGSFQEEYPIQPNDGSHIKWLRSTGKIFSDAAGQPRFISGTMMDITESKLAEQQKDNFISVASHELRTPVTVLKGTLQLLQQVKDNATPAVVNDLVGQAVRSTERIIALINELLNATRIKEGQLQLSFQVFKLSDMLRDISLHVGQQQKHSLIISGDIHLEVMGDEYRINQALENLVGNAVKYASNSPDIILHVEQAGRFAKISVSDKGPGIAADKIPSLFKRYYRADYSGSTYSGLGLGLFISAQIVERHGGQIGVSSKLGTGSTFWFTVPLG